jgi:ribonuclease HIII
MNNDKNKIEVSNIFVTTLDLKLSKKMLEDLTAQNFDITTPPHTFFSAKKKGVSCTFYKSGKLTVQGKEMRSFLEFYLEPQILGTFTETYKHLVLPEAEHVEDHIGIDESGKGDFFGPLCIAGVFAPKTSIARLKEIGCRDSKMLTDVAIITIGKRIKQEFQHHIVKINPEKYNELYTQFQNLNKLLAWGHATTIEQLVLKTDCHNVIIDQFASEHVVITALKRKKLEVNLTQRHRGEEDLVVAAASILARMTFLEGLEILGKKIGYTLPKGASKQTIATGKKIYQKSGMKGLEETGKLHFKTLDAITGHDS